MTSRKAKAMDTAELTKITIIEPTEIVGKPAKPGDEYSVPNEVTKRDAYTLIGIGKALPGPATKHEAAVKLAQERAAADAMASAERKKHSEPVQVRLAKAMELIAEQGKAISALAENVGQLVAQQVEARAQAGAKK